MEVIHFGIVGVMNTMLGYEITQPATYDEIRKIHICFLEKDGYRIELVSPASEDSVVSLWNILICWRR